MANPSSSHGHHRSSSSHHHHRTISSTTLLLIISLVLACLAVMLSIPRQAASFIPIPSPHTTHQATHHSQNAGMTAQEALEKGVSADNHPHDALTSPGFWGYLSPKRSLQLVSREQAVAHREAEVARREAELLAASPGGIALSCPPSTTEYVYNNAPPLPAATVVEQVTVTVTAPAPPAATQTVYHEVHKEVHKEIEPVQAKPPGWLKEHNVRVEELMEREQKVNDREKEVGRREETVGRRETDAGRRESWIMEQLLALEKVDSHTVEEEYVYETPRRASHKVPPPRSYD
ncbi:hypothetical protein BOTBODRAFT_358600 [Botryobasidium botryosum FD-172 SS1]|uniref:Transmembrane protein n=1 Tax=Botryobasidium botryosum (strain FD-172 SS1) TaxID=930990 RepID=A0A067MQ91_BOTB1|nr:hypothetical protein BOTBODRAFT_358600 [Botryobasidium botryosum FD-172 SS1]